MPRAASPARHQIAQILGEFANRIQKVVESQARPAWPDDVRARVLAALGLGGKRGPGRPPGSKNKAGAAAAAKPARKVTAAMRLHGKYLGLIRV